MKTDALGQKDNHSLDISSSSSMHLPKIQFQQFSGELKNWLRFHNQFKRIHDESLEDDTFQYLIQNTEVKKVNLSLLYDKIEAQLCALESLAVTKEKYAAILHAWERYVGYSSDESGMKDLDSLMKFLSIEVSSEDRMKLARNSFDYEKFNYKKKLGNLSTSADMFNSNFKNRKDFKFKNSGNNCIFCEKTHASENCCEATSMLYDKKNAVIQRGMCYICLKRGHIM
ncbi:DUF1758 domain-containing protein [Trichonephila clavipes]|nr:DUF1758 domain-containing protein [Trichonephila clavipes]